MFSEKWTKKTIEVNDYVDFNQFDAFKRFIYIIYGLHDVGPLTIVQACNVFFYADKYDVKLLKAKVLTFLKEKMTRRCLSINELARIFFFDEKYELGIKTVLDGARLALSENNVVEFYQMADELKLARMKGRIIDFSINIEPKQNWPTDFLCAVIEGLKQQQCQLKEIHKRNLELEKQKNLELQKKVKLNQRPPQLYAATRARSFFNEGPEGDGVDEEW